MTTRTYVLPVEQTRWSIPQVGGAAVLTFDYDEGRERLLALYEKGKNRQWNGAARLDWSRPVDPDSPLGLPEEYVPLAGSEVWEKLGPRERAAVRRHLDAWRFSQFLHGEQGALVCAAKIVETVPDLDSKLYAATQVVDEARHVEVFSRYLREKIQLAYPINPHLKTLLDQAIGDARWDLTYLAMQVIIEGLALAAFGVIRDLATEPLGRALVAYVMEDEARHVAFGRLALRDLYPQLTQQERDDREQFAVEACHLMRERFLAEEVWDHLDLGAEECRTYVRHSLLMQSFQRMLFSRIVPTLKDIGLFGPRVRTAFETMGVLEFQDVDLDALARQDEETAAAQAQRDAEARDREVRRVAAEGRGEA